MGFPADWWVTAETPFGWLSYRPGGVWMPGTRRAFAGGLFPLASFEVFDGAGLPPGDYTFFFAVDPLDGEPQGTVFDEVRVTIR